MHTYGKASYTFNSEFQQFWILKGNLFNQTIDQITNLFGVYIMLYAIQYALQLSIYPKF